MKNNKIKPDSEQVIGRAVSAALRAAAPQGAACPSEEEIAALVDLRLEGQTRDDLMLHISGCENCYAVFSLAAAMAAGQETAGKKPGRSFVRYAVAACLILTVMSIYLIVDKPFNAPQQRLISQSERPAEFTADKPAPKESPKPVDTAPAEPELTEPPRPKPKPILMARLELDEGLKDFLRKNTGELIEDEEAIGEIARLLRDKGHSVREADIKELRIERPEGKVKGFGLSPRSAEIELRNNVLTLRLK